MCPFSSWRSLGLALNLSYISTFETHIFLNMVSSPRRDCDLGDCEDLGVSAVSDGVIIAGGYKRTLENLGPRLERHPARLFVVRLPTSLLRARKGDHQLLILTSPLFPLAVNMVREVDWTDSNSMPTVAALPPCSSSSSVSSPGLCKVRYTDNYLEKLTTDDETSR